MGDHYVPQFYLRGFSADREEKAIWAFPKSGDPPFKTAIKNIAQESNLYTRKIEKILANEIEPQAARIIEKICEGNLPTIEEKLQLSNFMFVLWKRVPKHLELVEKKLPEILANTIKIVNADLEKIVEEDPTKKEIVERRRSEAAEILATYVQGDSFIENMWLEGMVTEDVSQVVEAMAKMTWRFAITSENLPYITSDNPLFFFTWKGIGKPDSEISFPLSQGISLWATWRTDFREDFFRPKNVFIKEINRRTASIAGKFLFSPKNLDWVGKLARKKKSFLNRIV